MTRKLFAAALLATCTPLALPVQAHSQQEQLDARYDRALAAGYKALFLCSAIANAERNGATRTPESVMEWELTGVYERIAPIIDTLEYSLYPDADGRLAIVEVPWEDDMPPRFAEASHRGGCRLAPIGLTPNMPEMRVPSRPGEANPPPPAPSRADAAMPVASSTLAADAPLAPIFLAAMDGTYGAGSRTTAVLVSANGAPSEAYREGFGPDTPQRTWSVAKSIAATLIGAAVERGEARTDQGLAYDQWRWDARREITIDNLLRMTSGRYSDTPGNRTDPLYMGGALVAESATGWPLLHEPGTVFRYANNDTLMAVKAIEDSFDSYDAADLFADIGMTGTVAETDWGADYILSSQVWSTTRDLAKLGQLYLDDGVLPSGERLLPEGWVEYVSSPSGPQPEGPFGYGAGFWLLNKSDGVPSDTFAAMGNRGQYVVIVPSRNVVIVRRGEDPTGKRFDIEAFTRDVLAALAE
ncbi:serine hydrolase domain-containing protein [Pseudoblastomonas halimionae]|uniref:Serine hydrolase n=1 Tax=Alteriqipengyuania halimionae TaxID=1926630 RepID=A0A6I4U6Q4_9SPHN|nr:serine hydrolase [Alteriqipengyuania halimionae]MXP09977.1 serine hydrolase [Alteriqipengyuania halimionae]